MGPEFEHTSVLTLELELLTSECTVAFDIINSFILEMSPVSMTWHSPDFPPTPLPTPSQVTSQAPLPFFAVPF